MENDDSRMKELKVIIPVELHLLLMRRKLLQGQTIASSVEEALRAYFAQLEGARPPLAPPKV